MRELVYFVATSLDGRLAGPDDDYSAFPMQGDHLDWIAETWTDTLPAPVLTALGREAENSRLGAVLMGWNTYAVGLAQGVDDPYPHLEQLVVTRQHLDHALPRGVRAVGDPAAELRRLREADGPGDVWLCGGGALAASLAGEIDRLVLKVNPVVLGAGPSLFDGSYDPRAWVRRDVVAFDSGVVVAEYGRER